jgi:hypothetical protein
MKHTLFIAAVIAGLFTTQGAYAQENTTNEAPKKKKRTITISNEGISVDNADDTAKAQVGKVKSEHKEEHSGGFYSKFFMLDLGVNMLNDATVYTDPTVVNYLNVPAVKRNENLFDLRPSKSINVNIYPVMVKFLALKTGRQRVYVSTGLGFQVYNFRYEDNLTYTKSPNGIIIDSIAFRKNKLAVNYLNIPLMITGKTRLYKDHWLTYGVGGTVGYRISSWNKQISDERGKQKTHGNFDLSDYNACITGEFGFDGALRFFASYQLTPLYTNGIEQYPICVGLRIGGI